jgi:transcriptional regulator with XRE-family HTH domain
MVPVTPPSKEELEALRESGLTRQEIADRFKVSVSQVKRWISSLQVKKKIVRKPADAKPPKPSRGSYLPEDEGLTVMEKAKRNLGPRLTEKKGVGYLVDGRVTNTDEVLRLAGVQPPNRTGW